jgi:hypothetical protein
MVWFKFKSDGFSKKRLKEDHDGGFILCKHKGSFANLLKTWLILEKFKGFLAKKSKREDRTAS